VRYGLAAGGVRRSRVTDGRHGELQDDAINLGDSKVQGTYVLINPPHRIAFTWGLHENTVLPEGSSTVEIYLTADGEETIVDLTHRDLPVREQAQHKEGWDMCLANLTETAHS